MKREAQAQKCDIYKALGVKALEGSETTTSTVSMQMAKSGAGIKYRETMHCIWSTVGAQQTCTMSVV